MFTYEELLELMIVESDNTAADMLLDIPGVNWYLGKLGIAGIRIDRGEGQMALDYAGVTDIPPEKDWTLDWFNKAMAAVPHDQQREAAKRFLLGRRDTATPEAMLKLLRLLIENKALSKQRTDLLLRLMRKTVPAAQRIKAGLPPGTEVAHRPGTGNDNEGINLCTNDVGIVTLPNGNHLLLAIFIKGSTERYRHARANHRANHSHAFRSLAALKSQTKEDAEKLAGRRNRLPHLASKLLICFGGAGGSACVSRSVRSFSAISSACERVH